MWHGGKRCLKECVDFLFVGHSVVSLHSPLLSVQFLSVEEIAEAEFGIGGPQLPEEAKSSDLLRITEGSCVCCFSAESSSKSLFSQYRLILAKEALFYSLTASSYGTDSFSFSISDQTAFFS